MVKDGQYCRKYKEIISHYSLYVIKDIIINYTIFFIIIISQKLCGQATLECSNQFLPPPCQLASPFSPLHTSKLCKSDVIFCTLLYLPSTLFVPTGSFLSVLNISVLIYSFLFLEVRFSHPFQN